MVCLIHKCNLSFTADVKSYISSVEKEILLAQRARSKHYNKLRRCTDKTEIAKIKAERDLCTAHLKGLRRDLKTAQSILETIPKVRENIAAEKNMERHIFGRSRPKQREWEYER